jgi:DNA adenine methylase
MDKMILRRLGNKKKLAKEIQKHFPPHKIYIEPFFGAGGMFFNKPKAKYNFLNDLDSDVFNLFQVVMNQKEELEKAFYMMPIHSDLLEYWKKNEETEPIKKALRFLLLSNYVLNGRGSSLRVSFTDRFDEKFNNYLLRCNDLLFQSRFLNKDFRKFLKSLSFMNDGRNDEIKTLIYCDPPYLETNNNYSESFTKEDSKDLFECLIATGCKFAISEFNNPIILDLAKQHNLEVITIGERQNLKNRRTEVLIVNYESPALYGLFGSNNLNG